MSFRSRRLIQFRLRTLLAALIALAIGLGLYRRTQLVPVAKVDIDAGAIIDPEMIEMRHQFHLLLPDDVCFEIATEKYPRAALRPIEAGDVITRSSVSGDGEVGIGSGYYANYTIRAFRMTFKVDSLPAEISWSQEAYPKVDVQVLLKGEVDPATVLRRITIHRIGRPHDNQGTACCDIVVRVNSEQANVLQLAAAQGELLLVPED